MSKTTFHPGFHHPARMHLMQLPHSRNKSSFLGYQSPMVSRLASLINLVHQAKRTRLAGLLLLAYRSIHFHLYRQFLMVSFPLREPQQSVPPPWATRLALMRSYRLQPSPTCPVGTSQVLPGLSQPLQTGRESFHLI